MEIVNTVSHLNLLKIETFVTIVFFVPNSSTGKCPLIYHAMDGEEEREELPEEEWDEDV